MVKDSIHLEYPLLILREQILDCAFKNITRNDQGVMEDFFFDYLAVVQTVVMRKIARN